MPHPKQSFHVLLRDDLCQTQQENGQRHGPSELPYAAQCQDGLSLPRNATASTRSGLSYAGPCWIRLQETEDVNMPSLSCKMQYSFYSFPSFRQELIWVGPNFYKKGDNVEVATKDRKMNDP